MPPKQVLGKLGSFVLVLSGITMPRRNEKTERFYTLRDGSERQTQPFMLASKQKASDVLDKDFGFIDEKNGNGSLLIDGFAMSALAQKLGASNETEKVVLPTLVREINRAIDKGHKVKVSFDVHRFVNGQVVDGIEHNRSDIPVGEAYLNTRNVSIELPETCIDRIYDKVEQTINTYLATTTSSATKDVLDI